MNQDNYQQFVSTLAQAITFSATQSAIRKKNVTTCLYDDNVIVVFSYKTKQLRLYIHGHKEYINLKLTVKELRDLLTERAKMYFNHLSVQGI